MLHFIVEFLFRATFEALAWLLWNGWTESRRQRARARRQARRERRRARKKHHD